MLNAGAGFEPTGVIALSCECGLDAEMPFREWEGNPVIAAIGLSLVFDKPGMGQPPHAMLPETVQCRKCRRIFTSTSK